MSHKIIKYNYNNSCIISPWHNIPYKDNDSYTFVCEIPKLTKRKIEMCTELENNPLDHD